MKPTLRILTTLAVGASVALLPTVRAAEKAGEAKSITIRVEDPGKVRVEKFEKKIASEKVTFLGVETAPVPDVLSSQLGLGEGIGLVVNRVSDDSPAAAALKEHDILTKFGDQLLVDSRQLSVLIRAKKPGDEVKLTLLRGGKESTVSVKLGEREMPRAIAGRGDGPGGDVFRFFHGEGPGMEHLRELPGIARDELNDALRVIGRERDNWFAHPRVHIVKRKGGSSFLNMAEGNFVFSDDDGSVEVTAAKGQREITLKDAKGNVTFKGPINSDDEREKLPPEVKKRLHKIDNASIDFEADENIEQDGAALKPEKTKISRDLGRDVARPVGRSVRAF